VDDLGKYLDEAGDNPLDHKLGVLPMPWAEGYTDVEWAIVVGDDADRGSAFSDYYRSSIVRGSFDHNGDGVSDIALGDVYETYNYTDGGVVRVFDGPVTASLGAADNDARLGIYYNNEYVGRDDIGERIQSAGDVNGDGYDDMAIASPVMSDGDLLEVGRIWVVPGPLVGAVDVEVNAYATFIGEGDYALFPDAVVTRGDVDGDGWIDLFASQAVDTTSTGHPYKHGPPANEYPGLRLFRGPLEGTYEWLDGVQIKDRWYTNPSEVSDFLVVDQDLDGDGLHDVVMTEEYAWRDDPEVEYGSRIGDAINIWFSSQSSEWPRPWAP
jgi:hypothetical protein